MFLKKTPGCGFPILALAIIVAGFVLIATTAHAQCGGYQPQYGVWRGLEVVIQPAPGLTIGFSTGPIAPYHGPRYLQPAPPPVFYGGPPQYYNGGYGGSPAYQQGYDAQMRRREREAREAWEQAERAAGRRAADREWGIGPAYGRRY